MAGSLTVNGGIGGASYVFVAPEAASSALATQYVDAINAAIASGNYQVTSPYDEPASGTNDICQADWNISASADIVSLSPAVTNLLIYGTNDTRVVNIEHDLKQPSKIFILDGAKGMMTYALSGAIGGNLTVLQASRIIDVGRTTENWTIAVNAGKAWQSDGVLPDQLGLDGTINTVLRAGGNNVITSNGENHVTVTGAQNLIGLGAGVNYLVSQGQDTVYGQGITGNYEADTSGGEALFNIGTTYGTSFVTINGGGGQFDLGQNASIVDSATVGSIISVQSGSSISGGAGSTVAFANAGGTGTISGAVGDTISAAGDLFVFQGQSQSINAVGALSFLNGTGDTTLSGGNNSTIWGAQGLNAVASMTGFTIFTANQPNATGNQTYEASATTSNVEYWSGPGSSSFIGGSGNNHFVFGTSFAGTSGDSFVTVTGGAGANSFGVLSGHTGGSITITDFDPSKGDFFFQYFYKPTDAEQAVRNLLATATVAGGNTTLQLDNNMQVNFLGVTNLDASAIRIS